MYYAAHPGPGHFGHHATIQPPQNPGKGNPPPGAPSSTTGLYQQGAPSSTTGLYHGAPSSTTGLYQQGGRMGGGGPLDAASRSAGPGYSEHLGGSAGKGGKKSGPPGAGGLSAKPPENTDPTKPQGVGRFFERRFHLLCRTIVETMRNIHYHDHDPTSRHNRHVNHEQ